VITTAEPQALAGFYTRMFGAEEIFRVPAEGPAFYLGLRIGEASPGVWTQGLMPRLRV
jgi:hypothetical protein